MVKDILKIGLTGGIGCGKSIVADYFKKFGVIVIDADVVAHDITQPGMPCFERIVEHFGPSILTDEKKLNRRKLRHIIFDNIDERKWLEQLLHPIIRDEMKRATEIATSPYCILVIPLLLENGEKHPLVDHILVVDAPEYIQIERAKARDNISEDQAKIIIAAQVNRQERQHRANDIIENDGDLTQLEKRVKALHEKYLKAADGI